MRKLKILNILGNGLLGIPEEKSNEKHSLLNASRILTDKKYI